MFTPTLRASVQPTELKKRVRRCARSLQAVVRDEVGIAEGAQAQSGIVDVELGKRRAS